MKSTKAESPTVLPGDGLISLDAILCTEELHRRPARAPDHAAENRALVALTQALADSPRTILQTLAETLLEVFKADSAGISLLTKDEQRFFWPAIAGRWKPHIGDGTPRDFGPCGDVLDCNAPLLFRHWERRYPYLLAATPPVEEALLVPFYIVGKAAGTIWAIAHDERRQFDAEDLRRLESLARFAAAAYQATELQWAKDSRRAALNLMEDAVLARQTVEKLNLELRESERRFREMIDVLPTAIYTTDAEGRLTHFNPAAVALAGHPPELGTDRWCVSWKLYYADGTPMPHGECPMAVALKENRVVCGEEAILERPDGTRIWFVPYPTPLYEPDGRLVGGINMLVDITERKQAEEESARIAAIVESSHDAIISKDLEGIIQTWNAGAQRIFGYTAQEAIGQSVSMLIPPDHMDEEPRILERIRRGKRVDHYETIRRRKDGTLVDISLTVSPILDARGRVSRASKIAHDITERKRAENTLQLSEQRYRRLFESSKDGILILDAETMRITDANPFMSELLSYPLDELRGKELWEIGAFQDKRENQTAIRKLREGGYVRYEDLPLKSAHGRIQEVELVCNIYREGHHAVAQCNIRDITARKRMERKIAQQAKQLAGINRRKDEFLAMLSHELRNPMAPMFHALQLIEQEGGENALQREARGVIERQVRHMSRMVDDLLEISRITTGHVHLHTERVAINAVIERAVERVRPLIERRKQQLSLVPAADTVWLDADATRLEQVFGNLLDNASKYNNAGGRIMLSVERHGGKAIIRVRDEGDGMATDTLPHIFDLFTQSDRSLDHSQGGLGIGLALVQSLVKMHRGTVEVHSEGIGRGSEFVVRLPVASETQIPSVGAAAPPDIATDGDSRLRVLVVDDNADAAKMSALLLRSWGYDVRVAHDGPGALQRATGFRPQVILLDIGLPDMDGYEVARLVRHEPQLKDVHIIAVTGYGQDTDRQRSKEAGFDHHLVKPVESSDLKALLAGFRPPPI